MKTIELLSNNRSETSISLNNPCEECNIDFEEENQLQNHMMDNHVKMKRNGRAFGYVLNEKKAKSKLLKGAKRAKHLDVEIKTGCVNMRFSDGSYFEVVLPILKDWHKQVKKPFKLNDIEVQVDEAYPGIENSDKHMDTKLIITVNKDRIVLHAYNGTQNLMVQGKNYADFAVNYLEPFFTEKILSAVKNIEKFNDGVCKALGRSKPLKRKTVGSKAFNCPHCKVKSSTVSNHRTH